MPLFYHKYVNYVLAHSVNYVITLYRLAPPVKSKLLIFSAFLIYQSSIASSSAFGIVIVQPKLLNGGITQSDKADKRSQCNAVTALIICIVPETLVP